MPQKKNSQSHVQKKLTPIKNWYHTHTQQFYIVTGITLALTALLLTWQLPIHKERTMYQNAEKQITQFVDEAAQLAPSTKEVRKYCRYSSEKFSRGSLGCTVDGEVVYGVLNTGKAEEIMKKLDIDQSGLGWLFVEDNTWSTSSSPAQEIKNNIYKAHGLNCGVVYRNIRDKDAQLNDGTMVHQLSLDIHCSGHARAEYFKAVDY